MSLKNWATRFSWRVRRKAHGEYRLHPLENLFSEPAVYEGFDRFAEVARILKARYGTRLRDLVPTVASGTYLYGDTYRSFSVVEGVRAELFGTDGD